MSADARTVLHVYGVVPAEARLSLPGTGVDGSAVALVVERDLAAVVSLLDAARYGEDIWREHAEDPRWLAAFATQHQDVLGAVAADCDVVPFRIPGMYDAESRLRRVLETERELLLRGLQAVRDHVEWGVQIFLTGRPDAEPAPRPRSGRDYLRSRSAQAGSREREAEERRCRVLDAYGRFAGAATHSVTNPPQDPALSQRHEPMLLNSAHLVPRDRQESFFAVLGEAQEGLRGSGMVVEVSGPWPPYNFVHLATEELRVAP